MCCPTKDVENYDLMKSSTKLNLRGLLAVAKIRQMYPEPSGQYVGFKRSKDDEVNKREKKGRTTE